VPAAAWQSKNARDALKILVARRGRPIHREALMEQLWPGEDPAKTANRLSVALSVVRSVLDPDRLHDQDHFLLADRLSVALAPTRIDIDIEAFLDTAAAGLKNKARSQLERAESIYRGDFLEEDPYEEWATPLRDEARTTYLLVARGLADLAEAEGDHDAAARYHLRLLERDPFDEPAHLGLVTAMARTGRYGEAHRLYRQYCARMAELDVEAAPFPAI
jgi:DNA-binding SARP family transcriptional activator